MKKVARSTQKDGDDTEMPELRQRSPPLSANLVRHNKKSSEGRFVDDQGYKIQDRGAFPSESLFQRQIRLGDRSTEIIAFLRTTYNLRTSRPRKEFGCV
jgi:hypothetical protein